MKVFVLFREAEHGASGHVVGPVYESRDDAEAAVARIDQDAEVKEFEVVPTLGPVPKLPPAWSASSGGNIAGRSVRDP